MFNNQASAIAASEPGSNTCVHSCWWHAGTAANKLLPDTSTSARPQATIPSLDGDGS
jgi:hypothetical protein